jgi:hypothetical protein
MTVGARSKRWSNLTSMAVSSEMASPGHLPTDTVPQAMDMVVAMR